MQLAAKHKRLWMNECSKAIFPNEEVKKLVKEQYEVLYEAYNDFYDADIKPHENTAIIYSLNTNNPEYSSFAMYSKNYDPVQYILELERSTPYATQSSVSRSGYSRITHRPRIGPVPNHLEVVCNINQPKKEGYLGSKIGYNVQLYLTDEQEQQLFKARTRLEHLKDEHEAKMAKIFDILESCKTHKQLKDKAPGIYMNKPAAIKELHDNAAKRKIKAQAKPAKQTSISDSVQVAEVNVPSELDTELAVAAFINQ